MTMEKPFAKLFNLHNGIQVLYYLDMDEAAKLVSVTKVQGLWVEISLEFKTPSVAIEALQDLTKVNAIAFRQQMETALDKMNEL